MVGVKEQGLVASTGGQVRGLGTPNQATPTRIQVKRCAKTISRVQALSPFGCKNESPTQSRDDELRHVMRELCLLSFIMFHMTINTADVGCMQELSKRYLGICQSSFDVNMY